MSNPTEHSRYWSHRLLVIVQQMAAQKTNAVLEVLGNIRHLETEQPYPEGGLQFAGDKWRAFYHCHESTSMHPDEHGHFHIFTAIGHQAWAHVAGLSIDAEGQPLQWFAVNRWVTDGPWLEQDRLLAQLGTAPADTGKEGLPGRWLVAMLQLYHDALTGLLAERDKQIQLKLKGRSLVETLDDRDIYTLATQSIDLQSMLEKTLLQNPCPDAEPGRQVARNRVCNSI